MYKIITYFGRVQEDILSVRVVNVDYSTAHLLQRSLPAIAISESYCREIVTNYFSKVFSCTKNYDLDVSIFISNDNPITNKTIETLNSFFNTNQFERMNGNFLRVPVTYTNRYIISIILLFLDHPEYIPEKRLDKAATLRLINSNDPRWDGIQNQKILTAFFIWMLEKALNYTVTRTMLLRNVETTYNGPAKFIYNKITECPDYFNEFVKFVGCFKSVSEFLELYIRVLDEELLSGVKRIVFLQALAETKEIGSEEAW